GPNPSIFTDAPGVILALPLATPLAVTAPATARSSSAVLSSFASSADPAARPALTSSALPPNDEPGFFTRSANVDDGFTFADDACTGDDSTCVCFVRSHPTTFTESGRWPVARTENEWRSSPNCNVNGLDDGFGGWNNRLPSGSTHQSKPTQPVVPTAEAVVEPVDVAVR